MRILVIEDDPVLSDMLVQSLTQHRYAVDTAPDGRLGWEYAQGTGYDLILIDVGLPRLDGITLCQNLRASGCVTPILLMTGKDATTERIRGLDAGADDYLVKPLDLGELQARVRALLRRGEGGRSLVLQVGALQLDPSSCQVTYGEKPLTLTPKEYSLLELFLRNPSRVFSRGQIVEHLWTFDDPPQEESVKAHIKGLRQKLKVVGANDWIENVYGLGYRLNTALIHQTRSAGEPGAAPQTEISTISSTLSATAVPDPSTTLTDAEPSNAAAPPAIEQEFNRARDALWLQYQGVMAQRLDVLQAAAMAGQTGQIPLELRQAAGQAAHKLAGVLGMFERDQGTQIARQLEQLLEGEENLIAAQRQMLRSLVEQLERSLDLAESAIAAPEARAIAPPTDVSATPLHTSPTRQPTIELMVVDDDPLFLAGLRAMLEPWGIRMTGLTDPAQVWQVLPTVTPDLLVLDVEMPQINGIELCQTIRSHPTWQALPILFLTAHNNPTLIQQIFAAGADDYVAKPVVGPELLNRIMNRLERLRLLQTVSNKDPLTGLANQPQSSRALEQLMQAATRDRTPVCLVLLHLLELRQINRQYGHAIGNQILQRWGQLLHATFPESAVLGYWGNGEFIIGLPQMTETEVNDRLTHGLRVLRQQSYGAPDGTRFQVNCGAAIAPYPAQGETLHALYQAAWTILERAATGSDGGH